MKPGFTATIGHALPMGMRVFAPSVLVGSLGIDRLISAGLRLSSKLTSDVVWEMPSRPRRRAAAAFQPPNLYASRISCRRVNAIGRQVAAKVSAQSESVPTALPDL